MTFTSIVVTFGISMFVMVNVSNLVTASQSSLSRHWKLSDFRDLRLYLSNVTSCERTLFKNSACDGPVTLRSTSRIIVDHNGSQIGRWFVKALCVGKQEPSSLIERGVVAQASEGIEELPSFGTGDAHVAGRDDGNAQTLGHRHGEARAGCEPAVLVSRHVEPAAPGEEGAHPVEGARREGGIGVDQGDQIARVLLDLVPTDAGLPLGRMALGHGQEP